MADITINWSDLGQVAGVSLGFGLGIAIVFSLGIIGVSQIESARGDNRTAVPGYLLAGVAFAACAAAVLYGLYLLIPQFH